MLDVRWVLMAKVSKTTNLIWVLSGGIARDMVPKSAPVWAQRITEPIALRSTP